MMNEDKAEYLYKEFEKLTRYVGIEDEERFALTQHVLKYLIERCYENDWIPDETIIETPED